MNKLLTGGSGLLGSEIRKLDGSFLTPTHAELDIADYRAVDEYFKKYSPKLVIHAAASTHPPKHETDPEIGIKNNIIGTANISLACLNHRSRLVYISTDYLYVGEGPHQENEPIFPPSRFVWSKLGGECSSALVPDSLIIRLSFGPVPFPWDKVYEGQFSSKLYVDEIAPLILQVALSDAKGIMNVGGQRTSLEEYAKRTKPDIQTIPKPEWVPQDTSLSIEKMSEAISPYFGLDESKFKKR